MTATDWHDISTAPKGARVDLWGTADRVRFQRWTDCIWDIDQWMCGAGVIFPSHWRPVPTPPPGMSESKSFNGSFNRQENAIMSTPFVTYTIRLYEDKDPEFETQWTVVATPEHRGKLSASLEAAADIQRRIIGAQNDKPLSS